MRLGFILSAALLAFSWSAQADNLFRDQRFAHLAADQKAEHVGDILTVVVYQSAEARNAADNDASKHHTAQGRLTTNANDQYGDLALGGDYAGHGEIRRSQSFVTEISVTISDVLDDGDYEIAGNQLVYVNGERTTIQVKGRVRPSDIDGDNQVLSTRIADAQINYNGQGFVSRNARPGLIQRLFGFLGLGG